MSDNNLSFAQHQLRATDSNSLLRLLDMATLVERTAPLQLKRERAGKLVLRIVKELQRRNLPVPAGATAQVNPATKL